MSGQVMEVFKSGQELVSRIKRNYIVSLWILFGAFKMSS